MRVSQTVYSRSLGLSLPTVTSVSRIFAATTLLLTIERRGDSANRVVDRSIGEMGIL